MQMQQLEDSGYCAFAFGIFEDVQFVSTTDATIFSHSAVIQFLSALIVASKYTLICSTRIFVCTCHCVGNPPQIDKVISEFLSTNAETKHCRRKTDNHPAEEEREMVGCDLQSSTGRKRKFTSSDHPNSKKRKTTSSQSKDPSSNTKSKAAGEGRLDLVFLLTSTNNTGNLPPSTSNHPHSNNGLPSSYDLPCSLHPSNSDIFHLPVITCILPTAMILPLSLMTCVLPIVILPLPVMTCILPTAMSLPLLMMTCVLPTAMSLPLLMMTCVLPTAMSLPF